MPLPNHHRLLKRYNSYRTCHYVVYHLTMKILELHIKDISCRELVSIVAKVCADITFE